VGSPLATFVVGGVPEWEMIQARAGHGGTVELELVDSRGATVPVLAGASPLEVDGDDLICVTFADVSAQKAQEREIARLSEAQAERMVELQDAETALTEQATHDALTGLPNRGLLFDRTKQALFHAKRSGLCTALLFVDLDEFKQVNDTARARGGRRRAADGRRSVGSRFCGPWTRSRASAATSSSSSHPASPASSTRWT
jgi:hypothetical protein